MPWFKVDDGLAFHRKTVAAGNAAMGLWVRSGSWCAQQLTDGFVPDHMIPILGTASQAARLVAAELWVKADGGFIFHQWSENGRQPTSESVRAERKRAAERQAEWRATKSAKQQTAASRNGVTPPYVTPDVTPSVTPTPTRPDPTRPSTRENTGSPVVHNTSSQPQRKPRAPRAEPDPHPDGFTDFWTAYPRRTAKRKAAEAFRAAVKRGAEPAELISAASRYAATVRHTEPRFVAHPATWLNQGRHEDEPDPTPPRTKSKTSQAAEASYAAGQEWLAELRNGSPPQPSHIRALGA